MFPIGFDLSSSSDSQWATHAAFDLRGTARGSRVGSYNIIIFRFVQPIALATGYSYPFENPCKINRRLRGESACKPPTGKSCFLFAFMFALRALRASRRICISTCLLSFLLFLLLLLRGLHCFEIRRVSLECLKLKCRFCGMRTCVRCFIVCFVWHTSANKAFANVS